jgi:hypothetical protein
MYTKTSVHTKLQYSVQKKTEVAGRVLLNTVECRDLILAMKAYMAR